MPGVNSARPGVEPSALLTPAGAGQLANVRQAVPLHGRATATATDFFEVARPAQIRERSATW